MTIAPHYTELHQLVDRLTAPEVEALYVLLRSTIGDREAEPAEQQDTPPRRHRLSFTGIVSAGPDFASTSAEVLRRELGGEE